MLKNIKESNIANNIRGTILHKKLREWEEIYLRDFVFVHINKTGGSSIEFALNIPQEHETALEKRNKIGEDRYNKKFSFSFVRNPFDRVVSLWKYREERDVTNKNFNRWVIDKYKKNKDKSHIDRFEKPQLYWITDESGEVIVDEIFRFEKIEDDYEEIKKRVGYGENLRHLKKTKRDEYKKYYDEEAYKLVKKFHYNDLDYFGYKF